MVTHCSVCKNNSNELKQLNSKRANLANKIELLCPKCYKRRKNQYRSSYYIKTYGITYKQYQTMLRTQKNCCAICKQEAAKTLAVDHCHKTGKVRGLLCSLCNTALGMFKDDVTAITRSLEYLK